MSYIVVYFCVLDEGSYNHTYGGVAERFKVLAWKASVAKATAGSNPVSSA